MMSGKSLGSLATNVLDGEFGMMTLLGELAVSHSDRWGRHVITVNTSPGIFKDIYCFGASDDASYKTIQGCSPGGWYADEIANHALSFIRQAFARTMASAEDEHTGQDWRQHFWTMNPENPGHYVYTEFLDPYTEKEPEGGFNLFKFYLDDNPAMSEKRKSAIRSQYSGVFYRRNILGERCVAEGAIYGMIDEENYYYNTPGTVNGIERKVRPVGLPYISQRYIVMDYGPTVPSCFLDIYDDGENIWVDREYYYDPRQKVNQYREKDPTELTDDFKRYRDGEQFDGHEFIGCPIPLSGFSSRNIIDPRANAFITTMRNAGIAVEPADSDVLDGIIAVSSLIKNRNYLINRDNCPNHYREMTGYAWDEKAAKLGESKPLKINDHSVDCGRYFVKTCLPSYRYAPIG